MSKKVKTVYLPVLLVVVLIITAGVYWYIDYSRYVSTDDAYVEFYTVTAGSKIMGRLTNLYVQEGDKVKKGDLLFELDSTDLVAQRAYLESMKIQEAAKADEASAKYALTGEQLKVLQVEVDRAREDYGRAKAQFDGGVITREAYDHAKSAYNAADARYLAGGKELALAAAAQKSSAAAVEAAGSQIDVVRRQLDNSRVYAPADGVIAKRWMLAGDIAQAGQSVFSIVESHDSWVKVYLEETKLGDIHEGSKSKYTIDAYPDVTFEGSVYYLGASTESQFSLIPPNNASGNFTKVTQRIPVKISIDSIEEGGDLRKYPLMSGMSAVVKIYRN